MPYDQLLLHDGARHSYEERLWMQQWYAFGQIAERLRRRHIYGEEAVGTANWLA